MLVNQVRAAQGASTNYYNATDDRAPKTED